MIKITRKEAQQMLVKEEDLSSLFINTKSQYVDENNGVYEIQTIEIEDGAVQRARHLDNGMNPLGNWKCSTRS
jgi:hypothetical protein